MSAQLSRTLVAMFRSIQFRLLTPALSARVSFLPMTLTRSATTFSRSRERGSSFEEEREKNSLRSLYCYLQDCSQAAMNLRSAAVLGRSKLRTVWGSER